MLDPLPVQHRGSRRTTKRPTGCFHPDCGFGITADAAAKVAETNENNNKASGACIG